MKRVKIGIVGYGEFSKFIIPLLSPYMDIYIYVRPEKKETLQQDLQHTSINGVYSGSDSDLKFLDYFVFSVPLQSLEQVCNTFQTLLSSKTILIDVTSVKIKPLKLLQKYFRGFEIVGTHPIFGPQSGKNGLEGLPFVITNVSASQKHYLQIKRFLQSQYDLQVIEMTAEEHDREIAYIQGLSHLIGRSLLYMNIKDYSIATKSYRQLLGLVDLLKDDSFELYKTIQNGNPYTQEVRRKFIDMLHTLEDEIK